ncbi:ferric reduction oxidase 4-like isoform X1 [Cucurbita pepo subsp. pepo]|uniref:ferric reduction oxidase 4-like isoform X1 n=1 Tax=Cucurbita pepo subsp. pepo TaxID=3664 RepID=UPI000C9D7140|nr:ferric reduction oxidase 4-like isoform X1 [Cucurbita pepo subsp. pepo]
MAKEMAMVRALKMIFLLTFVLWLWLWIMLPTKLYKNTWTPKLKMELNSTYFREQGTNLLLFSFPIMFMAVLGCFYLHLQKNSSEDSKPFSTQRSRGDSFLKRPILAMNPLGIVNTLEIGFAAAFVILLIWSLGNYLYVSFGNLHMHGAGEKIWEAKFRSVSLRLGYIGHICWAFLFFPVTRGSSLLPLIGLTSESTIKYHIWLGHISNLLFALHTVGFIIYWGITDQMALLKEWSEVYVSNVAGLIAMAIATVIWVTSFRSIRQKMFEVFFYSHHLYTLYTVFYLIHVGAAYVCMILPGMFLFAIDRFLRFLQSQWHVSLVSARHLPCGVVELNLLKSPELSYSPTSVMFLNVPSISKLQWHPFTITSNSKLEPDIVSVVSKVGGSWTSKLHQQLSSSLDHLQVSVEGPYGPASTHFLRHESLLLISGGSGITPFISIIREIMIVRSTKPDCHVPQVRLICAFKNSMDLTMLDLLLPVSSTQTEISNVPLQIEAYITREEEPPQTNEENLVNTIWFKPNPLDSPVSEALGPNHWLLLGAVISSSFVMFLILLGIITRYYIYPIERNGDAVYNYTYKVLWDMFLALACICISSSLVLVWQRKTYVSNKRVQVLSVQSPKASPGSWIYGGERELESSPYQSLVQATNIHYGSRPDLKKILLDCKGSDIGVLVSGPTRLRHDVAKICSTACGDNLKFHALSFTW